MAKFVSPGNLTQVLGSVKTYIDTNISDSAFATVIVAQLPSAGETGTLYLVGTAAPYEAYIWDTTLNSNAGGFIAIGNESAMTGAEVTAMLQNTGFEEQTSA